MSGLSEEQRRRMEENRRRALQKRKNTGNSPIKKPSNIGNAGTGNFDTGNGNLMAGNTGTGNLNTGTGNFNTGTGNLIAGNTGTGNFNTGTGNLIAGNTGTGNLVAGNTGTGNFSTGPSGTGNLIAGNTGTGNFNTGTGNISTGPSTSTSNQSTSPRKSFIFRDTNQLKPNISLSKNYTEDSTANSGNHMSDEARRIEENRMKALEKKNQLKSSNMSLNYDSGPSIFQSGEFLANSATNTIEENRIRALEKKNQLKSSNTGLKSSNTSLNYDSGPLIYEIAESSANSANMIEKPMRIEDKIEENRLKALEKKNQLKNNAVLSKTMIDDSVANSSNFSTDDLKRKMEENRRKALEKRASKNLSQNMAKSDSNMPKSDMKLPKTDSNMLKSEMKLPKTNNYMLLNETMPKSDMKLSKTDSSMLKSEMKLPKTNNYMLLNETMPKTDMKLSKTDSSMLKSEMKLPKTNNNMLLNETMPKTDMKLAKTDSNMPKTETNLPGSVFYKSDSKVLNDSRSNLMFPSTSNNKSENSVANVQVKAPVFNGPTVNGTFRLISTDKFTVDVGFHKQMIEVFKTMETKMYDATTRLWNFSLSEHDKLVSALVPLRPAVCISPIPPFVRQVLRTLARQVPASCIDLFGLDPTLLDALMPFQHDGVCFGVSRGGRVMFADDMGLGKTIQALGVATHYRSEWPLLIVTPSSVRYAWFHAIQRWVTTVDRCEIIVAVNSKDYIRDYQVVIMSYDILTRRSKEVLDIGFDVIILDESHMIKNFKAARYKAVSPLMKRARRCILLSGTPALSRPSELYTQISGIDPKIFPSFQDFGMRYCGGKQSNWGMDFSGSSNMQELQILLEAKFMIRRLKSQVLDQLPAKQRMTVILDHTLVESKKRDMEESAKRLGLQSLKGKERYSALIEFFCHTAQAKLRAVGEYVKEMLECDKKFLVFAHHQIMMDKLCEVCDKAKAKYIRIDGKTGAELRQNLCTRFQTDDTVKVAVLSITAANTGITLTAAQLVIFAELFWNPGALIQAEDRAHRIGQQDCVIVQYLVGKDTADDYMWPLVKNKLNVLGEAGLTEDDFDKVETKKQKSRDKDSILQYLREMQDDEQTNGSPAKKRKL